VPADTPANDRGGGSSAGVGPMIPDTVVDGVPFGSIGSGRAYQPSSTFFLRYETWEAV